MIDGLKNLVKYLIVALLTTCIIILVAGAGYCYGLFDSHMRHQLNSYKVCIEVLDIKTATDHCLEIARGQRD